MIYDELMKEADDNHINVDENYSFADKSYEGLYVDGNIALSDELETTAQKSCILAEELGHHYTSYGVIIDQKDPNNRRQEFKARCWGYNRVIGLNGLIRAYESHQCFSLDDMADFFGVTGEYIVSCIQRYKDKYGCFTEHRGYIIMFEPSLAVMKKL